MARREWDPELLEQVLSRLEGCPHSSLSGRSGRLVHELRRSSELKTLWSAFEAHENGPWGAGLADRHAIHSFLDTGPGVAPSTAGAAPRITAPATLGP